MDLDIFLQKSANKVAENRLLKFALICLVVFSCINYMATYNAIKSQKIILVPPSLSSKVTIIGEKASKEYVEYFVRYFVSLTLTYTPQDAQNRFDEALTLYDHSEFVKAKKKFYEIKDTISKTNATSIFSIQKIVNDENSHIMKVYGVRRMWVGDMSLSPEAEVYFLKYNIVSGQFKILEFHKKTDMDEKEIREIENANKK